MKTEFTVHRSKEFAYLMREMQKEKKVCDLCGKIYTGKSYPVYDENYNKQHGLIQCGKCLANKINT